MNERYFRTALGLACCVVWLSGCGQRTYERRLAETQKLFDYVNQLDEALGREWSTEGVSLRMPKQFAAIPAPQIETNEAGEIISQTPDLRQPAYMTAELPGLLGAWEGSVRADVAGELRDVPAYAYVLSNHSHWLNGDVEAATIFHNSVLESVRDGLSLTTPSETDWEQERFPRSPGFVKQKEAQAWRTKTTRLVNETLAQSELYLFQNGDIRLAILFVFPDTIDPQEKLHSAIELALETLDYSGDLPTREAGSGSGSSTGGF